MNILLLCEGDPATRDSWSGLTLSLFEQLRARDHRVHSGDVELHGVRRWVAAGASFSPERRRWSTRFRLHDVPFRYRSRAADRHLSGLGETVDFILQIGATFAPRGQNGTPYFLLCDSNIHMAREAAATGHSEAVALTEREIAAVDAREAEVYARATGIFTISEWARRSFTAHYGVPADRVHAVYPGPNFDPRAIPAAARSAELDHPPRILFVGRQFERKGGDVLLAAFRQIRRELPDAMLTIVGPDHKPADEPGVQWLGFLDKDDPSQWAALARAYAGANVFCLPTRFEPLGVAFIEAMYFGLPCVGTNVCAVGEMIVDGETGHLVERNDVSQLGDRLLRLLRDPATARRMGEAGRARAKARFSWGAVADRILEAASAALQVRR